MLEVLARPEPVGPSPQPTPVPTPEFLERFLLSPGAAGLAALCAAIIAYLGLTRQLRIADKDRQVLVQQQQEARWWDTLTWVYDRTVVEKGKKDPLPVKASLAMFEHLKHTDAGKGPRETAVIQAISREVYVIIGGTDSPRAPGSAARTVNANDPDAVRMLLNLRGERGAAKGVARWAAYHREVAAALQRCGGEVSERSDVDFAVAANGSVVLVEVRVLGAPAGSEAAVRDAVVRLTDAASGGKRGKRLLVTDMPLGPTAAAAVVDQEGDGVDHVVWAGPEHDNDLAAALAGARPQPAHDIREGST